MFCTIEGTKIYYIKKGSGPALVLLHGFLKDSRDYLAMIDILSKHYTVYFIDLPFHGKSGTPKSTKRFSDITDIIAKCITHFKLQTFVLMGHSAGAMIAVEYLVAKGKDKISKLILIDPAGLAYYTSFRSLLRKVIIIPFLRGIWDKRNVEEPITKAHHANFKRNMLCYDFRRLFYTASKINITSWLEKIQCPTILLWGSRDKLFPISYAKVFVKHIKKCILITTNGGHDRVNNNPNEVKKII